MYILLLLHLFAAVLWVGGMLFLALVLVPTLRREAHSQHAPLLIRAVGVRFRHLAWPALLVLLATGSVNLVARLGSWKTLLERGFWSGAFGITLSLKLLLVGLTVALSLVHDFYVGPRAATAPSNTPAAQANRMRRLASWIGRINLLLSLVIVALGLALARGVSW